MYYVVDLLWYRQRTGAALARRTIVSSLEADRASHLPWSGVDQEVFHFSRVYARARL